MVLKELTHFYSSWERHRTYGFLMVSGGLEPSVDTPFLHLYGHPSYLFFSEPRTFEN